MTATKSREENSKSFQRTQIEENNESSKQNWECDPMAWTWESVAQLKIDYFDTTKL